MHLPQRQHFNEKNLQKVLTRVQNSVILNVPKAVQKGGGKMKRNRPKKHPEYYAIPAYQRLARLSDEDVARYLGVTVRTYKDKINGYSDFSNVQGEMLARLLNQPQRNLFLT